MKGFSHYYEKLFGINLYWFQGSREEYAKLIKKELGVLSPQKSTQIRGTFEVYKKEGKWIGVIWLRKKNLGVLVHEAFHAVHWSLYDKGFNLTDSSEEAYCYMLQSLVEEMK